MPTEGINSAKTILRPILWQAAAFLFWDEKGRMRRKKKHRRLGFHRAYTTLQQPFNTLVAVQDEADIGERVIVDKAVQLQSLETVACRLILRGDAVDGDYAVMLKLQLLLLFIIVRLISFPFRFSRLSGFGFRMLYHAFLKCAFSNLSQ